LKDCKDTKIKIGDLIATTVTCNQETFKDPFTLFKVVKYNPALHGKITKPKNSLILDGVFSFGALEDHAPEDLYVLTKETNLQDVFCYFAQRQRKHRHHTINKVDPSHWKQTPLGMLEQIVKATLKLPNKQCGSIITLELRVQDELGGSDVQAYLSNETAFFANKILLAQQEKKRLENQRKLWKLECEGDIAAGI
jgi:hypothetical protein